jgi:hypothetical protein
MSDAAKKKLKAGCACGCVEYEALGAPITSVICYCASCQKAGRDFEQFPGAPPVLDSDGDTAFVLYRRDRVRCRQGRGHLKEYRLNSDSPTRRVVATCCNSAIFLDFTKGHWLSIYRCRVTLGAPEIEMRVMTQDRRAAGALASDVPNYRGRSGRFMAKLLAAWVAMKIRPTNFDLGEASGR